MSALSRMSSISLLQGEESDVLLLVEVRVLQVSCCLNKGKNVELLLTCP
jgi:hypothetical protein